MYSTYIPTLIAWALFHHPRRSLIYQILHYPGDDDNEWREIRPRQNEHFWEKNQPKNYIFPNFPQIKAFLQQNILCYLFINGSKPIFYCLIHKKIHRSKLLNFPSKNMEPCALCLQYMFYSFVHKLSSRKLVFYRWPQQKCSFCCGQISLHSFAYVNKQKKLGWPLQKY